MEGDCYSIAMSGNDVPYKLNFKAIQSQHYYNILIKIITIIIIIAIIRFHYFKIYRSEDSYFFILL